MGTAGGFYNTRKQKELLDYQKNLQREIFKREDTAVQRRVKDLEAAGLSKTLAAGGAAQSGHVAKTEAPQFNAPDMSGVYMGAEGYTSDLQRREMKERLKLIGKQINNADETAKHIRAMTEAERAKVDIDRWNLEISRNLGMKTTDPLNLSTLTLRSLTKPSLIDRFKKGFGKSDKSSS